ncbi:MAG: glycosyltransferase [Deltaproteobacteria bacterium]|nr:glycosyltransferase [Candidatus Anaeroferrophillacea bacterium]
MHILMITWEFPPFISGGLGTACYGIARALLNQGVKIDLVLPTREAVYFPLREPADVDRLPARPFYPVPVPAAATTTAVIAAAAAVEPNTDPGPATPTPPADIFPSLPAGEATVIRRLETYGLIPYPEAYITPALADRPLFEPPVLAGLQPMLHDDIRTVEHYMEVAAENLFRKVRELGNRVKRLAAAIDFDLIHAHDWLTVPAAMTARAVSRKPLVFHIHATEFDRAGGPGDERVHKLEYLGLATADLVLAVSRYTMEMVANRYRVDPARVRVVHNAFNAAAAGDGRRRLFRGPTVLFLGRITLQKGPDYFLDIARKVLERQPETRFIMAGSGDMMNRMVHHAAYHRLHHRFLFTGFLNKDEVNRIFDATDIFVMPSISEPFGIVPLEAMARGAVAIISKQSGVAEVLKHAYQVDFWDIDEMVDTISRLIDNPVELEKMAAAGQAEVAAIQWDDAAEKIVAAYREVTC